MTYFSLECRQLVGVLIVMVLGTAPAGCITISSSGEGSRALTRTSHWAVDQSVLRNITHDRLVYNGFVPSEDPFIRSESEYASAWVLRLQGLVIYLYMDIVKAGSDSVLMLMMESDGAIDTVRTMDYLADRIIRDIRDELAE